VTRHPSTAAALVRAAHAGPTVAVTVLFAAYAVSVGLEAAQVALVAATVFAGQLSIGWSNDLLDARRDRAVHRPDKPLATGAVSSRSVVVACALSVVATLALSWACGLLAGAVHLVCVAAGWAYNLGLKSTVLSWLPYAVAFGGLPVFVVLVGTGDRLPPVWVPLAGALLGVGAHIVNVLPDLADDAVTGVRGLPHRIGARRGPVVAATVLASATVVIAVGAAVSVAVLVGALALVGALVALVLLGRGGTPFRAAVGIALVDVTMLVVAA
jgi:4-hydroxybenzoate polyprenyltransferase